MSSLKKLNLFNHWSQQANRGFAMTAQALLANKKLMGKDLSGKNGGCPSRISGCAYNDSVNNPCGVGTD